MMVFGGTLYALVTQIVQKGSVTDFTHLIGLPLTPVPYHGGLVIKLYTDFELSALQRGLRGALPVGISF
jgi:hypothetical protein